MKTMLAVLILTLTGCKQINKLASSLGDEKSSVSVLGGEEALEADAFASYMWKEMGWTPHALNDAEIRQVATKVVEILQKDDPDRKTWHDEWCHTAPMYLDAFMWYPAANKNGAFCQKSALSVSEALIRMGVKSRQIHMFNLEAGVGDHQFLQYQNPVTGAWAVIDPYYGIYYEKDGKLMGRDDMETFVNAGGKASTLIRVYDTTRGGAGAGSDLDEYWSTRQIRGGLGYLSLKDELARYSQPH